MGTALSGGVVTTDQSRSASTLRYAGRELGTWRWSRETIMHTQERTFQQLLPVQLRLCDRWMGTNPNFHKIGFSISGDLKAPSNFNVKKAEYRKQGHDVGCSAVCSSGLFWVLQSARSPQ